MYSVTVPVGEAASHVTRHDGSFGRHVCATQTAIEVQAGSFGQLVAFTQQCSATQVAHEDSAVLKISLAPAHVPPSPTTTVLLSVGPPPSPCAEEPPAPPTGPPQFEQGPSKGGLGPLVDEEQAAARVARAAARPAPRPAIRREVARKPMAIDFLGLWSWRLSSGDVRSRAREERMHGRGRLAHGRAHFPHDRARCRLLALEGHLPDRL
jgi:hypothetical protein